MTRNEVLGTMIGMVGIAVAIAAWRFPVGTPSQISSEVPTSNPRASNDDEGNMAEGSKRPESDVGEKQLEKNGPPIDVLISATGWEQVNGWPRTTGCRILITIEQDKVVWKPDGYPLFFEDIINRTHNSVTTARQFDFNHYVIENDSKNILKIYEGKTPNEDPSILKSCKFDEKTRVK